MVSNGHGRLAPTPQDSQLEDLLPLRRSHKQHIDQQLTRREWLTPQILLLLLLVVCAVSKSNTHAKPRFTSGMPANKPNLALYDFYGEAAAIDYPVRLLQRFAETTVPKRLTSSFSYADFYCTSNPRVYSACREPLKWELVAPIIDEQ